MYYVRQWSKHFINSVDPQGLSTNEIPLTSDSKIHETEAQVDFSSSYIF